MLSGVPFVDSAGLGEIVRAANNAKKAGGAAKLATPTDRIVDLLRIAKVQGFIESYATEDDAVRSFATR
jgi:anti-sigma B factor antagonist